MSAFRLLLLSAALSLSAAWGADFDVSFAQPAKLGNLKVEAGRYKLRVQGSVVILTAVETNKSTTALARIEKTDKPAGFTAVLGASADGIEQVDQIILTGANFKLRFGN